MRIYAQESITRQPDRRGPVGRDRGRSGHDCLFDRGWVVKRRSSGDDVGSDADADTGSGSEAEGGSGSGSGSGDAADNGSGSETESGSGSGSGLTSARSITHHIRSSIAKRAMANNIKKLADELF